MVSVVALGVGVYSAYVDRAFARASVWPSLLVAQSFNSERFRYVVLNQGTGPAIIEYASVTKGDSVYKMWVDWLADEDFADATFAQSHIGGGVVRAGQVVAAFETKEPELMNYLSNGSELSIEICYCSVFKDCWVVNGFDSQAEVEACSVESSERFAQ